MEVTKKFIEQESKEPEHKGTKIAMKGKKGAGKASLGHKLTKMFGKSK